MKIEVFTNHRLAVNSPEYKLLVADPYVRCGATVDYSKNIRFNLLVLGYFGRRDVSVLDLGCSGGGFIEDCVHLGQIAVGIEGTDYSLKNERAGWKVVPNNLFVADITRPFQVLVNSKPFQFDLITSWEVMEHLPEKDLYSFCDNLNKHIKNDGIYICSISTEKSDTHPTCHEKVWWIEFFKKQGFAHDESLVSYFGDNWIRGPQQQAPGSFHLCLRPT